MSEPRTDSRIADVAPGDIVFFDGTLFRDDEMITTGTGAKTGRRMGHMPIDGDDGSLAALEGLAGRRVYVHINNTNPILIAGSPERLSRPIDLNVQIDEINIFIEIFCMKRCRQIVFFQRQNGFNQS
jgi:pyrroloquinoline quinone biosynthesis protein B